MKRLNLFKNCLSSFSDVKNDNIKCLDIGFNNFENIPLSFENLTILNAEHNFISVIDTSYNIFTKLTRLILNSNNVTVISDNICFPQLLIFDVSYNQLIELPNISIIMPKLKTLDASFNSLKKVPVLPQSLINLYLHHNHINDIKNFFESFVIKADLSYNDIDELLDIPCFLATFNIENNKLTKLNPINSNNILSINFRNNALITIPYVNVTELQFSFNLISSLENIIFNSITFLDITGNDISSIPNIIFQIPSLKKILASHNHISTLPNEITESSIIYIDLSFNPIRDVKNIPSSIEVLILNYCELEEIPKILLNCDDLVELSIQGNKIKAIDLFPKNLVYFNASQNLISDIINLESLTLEYLNISSNSLTSIPSNFLSNLPNLKEIDLTFNKIHIPQGFFNNSHSKLTKIFIDFQETFQDNTIEQYESINYFKLVSANIKIYSRVFRNVDLNYISSSNFFGQNELSPCTIFTKLISPKLIENKIIVTGICDNFKKIRYCLEQYFNEISQNGILNIKKIYEKFIHDLTSFLPFAVLTIYHSSFFCFFIGNYQILTIDSQWDLHVINNISVYAKTRFFNNKYLNSIDINIQNIKYIIILKDYSFSSISTKLIIHLAQLSENANIFTDTLNATITSSINHFLNCPILVLDIQSYHKTLII